MNELSPEQAVLRLGPLILMDCDWLILVAAMFSATTHHFLPTALKVVWVYTFTDFNRKRVSTGV